MDRKRKTKFRMTVKSHSGLAPESSSQNCFKDIDPESSSG